MASIICEESSTQVAGIFLGSIKSMEPFQKRDIKMILLWLFTKNQYGGTNLQNDKLDDK